MNIIVQENKAIRFTQYSSQLTYNIEDIKFYIAKTFVDNDIWLDLVKLSNTYSFLLEKEEEAANYFIYKVVFTQTVHLSEREYYLVLNIGENDKVKIGAVKLAAIDYVAPVRMMMMRAIAEEGMTDWHEPIEIVDRDIIMTNNQNVLLAQDNISQMITFKMHRYYENIDLSAKNIWIDFIDPASQELRHIHLYDPNPEEGEDYSDNIEILDSESGRAQDAYMLLKWVVPYAITKKAGRIKFAISAIGDNLASINVYYVWQTKPAELIIQPNLALRDELPENVDTDELSIISELADSVNNLQQQVNEIQESDVYSVDFGDKNDGEVILDAGGAEEEVSQ